MPMGKVSPPVLLGRMRITDGKIFYTMDQKEKPE